jgi:hypothetical protein
MAIKDFALVRDPGLRNAVFPAMECDTATPDRRFDVSRSVLYRAEDYGGLYQRGLEYTISEH